MSETTNDDGSGDGGAEPGMEDESGRGRRLMLKGGIAAAAAATVGLARGDRARAANGDPIEAGDTTNATATTTLTGGSTFRAINGSTAGAASLYGTQNNGDRFGVRGENTAGGTGVYGVAGGGSGGSGVRGTAAGSDGAGVRGESTLGAGVVGAGATYDVMADGNGRIGLAKVGQGGASDSPGDLGVIARDADGNLWYAFAAGQWRRLAGPSSAGAFHPVDPARAYDSRLGAYSPSGRLSPSGDRVISVADGHDSAGAVDVAGVVPAGATAVAYNVTVTGTTGPNFLSVVPGDASAYTASTINWSGAGESLANGAIVKLDGSRQVKIFCGDQPGSTHVIIDITGYFL